MYLFGRDVIESEKSYQRMNDALESFKVIYENFGDELNTADEKVDEAARILRELERRLLRDDLRKQGKKLLKCKYSKRLGCFGKG